MNKSGILFDNSLLENARDKKLVPDSGSWASRLLFDRRDYELIRIVNDVCARDRDFEYARRQYYGYFHPHGIKEMAESRSLRTAYAMVHLLTSLEIGGMDDRLSALRSLRAEVLDTAEGPMPKNTARVLMQIMKDVVRTRHDPRRQLELAHDFRITASGKPRIVRKQLNRYHLLEMPEEWNQITFDDHVHDVNTKGRKSSTHLIMDAWIKGIRRLRVVHYNYIEPRFATELLEAARIMEIDIRIGIEFSARLRNKYINLIWAPRGFPDSQAFLCFLEEPEVVKLMEEGRNVSAYQQAYVMDLLKAFNHNHLSDVGSACGIELEPIDEKEFLAFVGIGQKSTLHLEKFIQQKILAALQQNAQQLRTTYQNAGDEERRRVETWFDEKNRLDVESLIADFLTPPRNPDIPDPSVPSDDPAVPAMLMLTPAELLNRLAALQSGYRITLNLSNLEVEDVLELLYDCDGKISRLELFNLKDWAAGKTGHIDAISRLQEAINEQSPIALKRMIQEVIQKVAAAESRSRQTRTEKLTAILHDIASLQIMYKGRPLKARLGSDSTGRSFRSHGMGLAVAETLPRKARKQIKRDIGVSREIVPIRIAVHKRHTFLHRENMNQMVLYLIKSIPFLRWLGYRRRADWDVLGDETRMVPKGNVVTLGGANKLINNDLFLHHPDLNSRRKRIPWGYFNSHLRNIVKVLIGFVPAFATFALTKDWWLLAYFGAFIWFGITGIRNVLQSVLGGGGFRRSPLLRWNAYVSWDRISDSLLFTGFSVPLLEYLVKTVILDRMFNITTSTQPALLYSVMALVNGIYLSSHNAFRGLSKGAIFGNFFRSVLSIPIAIGLNYTAGAILTASGVAAAAGALQKWAAIISKTASDIVAGIIEGTADRFANIRLRSREYYSKLLDLIEIYAQLELLFPESSTFERLTNPQKFKEKTNAEAQALEKIICIHALDGLYFWMYQPRARGALRQLMDSISEEERHIWVTSQFTLLRQREISQMFIDGVLGPDFGRALSFYLSRHPEYLESMKHFA
ncbi:MAG: hypothetical protein AB1427_11130 [Thermodesulfobacteriota bacterium]